MNLRGNLPIELLAFVEASKMVHQEFEISFKFCELCYTGMCKKEGEIIIYSEQASLSGPHSSLSTLFLLFWLKTVTLDGSTLSVTVISYQVFSFLLPYMHHKQRLDHIMISFDHGGCGWKPLSPQPLPRMGPLTIPLPGVGLQR